MIGVTVLFVLYGVYARWASTAPHAGYEWFYDVVTYASYFGTHLAFGFSVAEIATILVEIDRGAAKSKKQDAKGKNEEKSGSSGDADKK